MNDLLKTLRVRKGMSQAALASKIGTSQPVVAEIEAGKRPLSDAMALRLASVLDSDAAALKRSHAETSMLAMLDKIGRLNDADIAALLKTSRGRETVTMALKALANLNDADLPVAVRKSAATSAEQLAGQVTRSLDPERDAFGRVRKAAAPVNRDLFGRRKRTPTGESR